MRALRESLLDGWQRRTGAISSIFSPKQGRSRKRWRWIGSTRTTSWPDPPIMSSVAVVFDRVMQVFGSDDGDVVALENVSFRSEERRVGKECGWRWWVYVVE